VNLDGREMPNDGDLVDLVLEWVPGSATRDRILIENPCALYGFPSPKQVSVG
jgi:predicted TIM-barrel fold metal-dependent hydrolase